MKGKFNNNILVLSVFLFLTIVFSGIVISVSEVNVGAGSYNLTVYVNDSTDYSPLEGANVTLWNGATQTMYGSGYYLQTDSNGKVVFYNLTSGNYSAFVNNIRGYNIYTPADTFIINDTYGNYTFNVSLLRDFIAPHVLTVSSPSNNTKSTNLQRTFSFTVDDDLDDLINVSLYINNVYNQSWNGTGANSFTLTMGEGNYYWNLTARDYWNNSNNTGSYNLTLDNSSPTYIDYNISTWSASGIGSQNASQFVYIWANFNGTYTNITSVGLDVNTSGATYGTYTNSTHLQNGYYNFSFLMPNSTVGEIYEFKLTAIDEVSLTNTTTSFFVNLTDNIIPTISTISPEFLFIKSGQPFTINVTSVDNIDSILDLNISFINESLVAVENITYSTRSGNEYRFTPTSQVVQGNYSILINSTDDWGNMNFNDTTWVVVDDIAPVINVGLSKTTVSQNMVVTIRANVSDQYGVTPENYRVSVSSNQSGTFTVDSLAMTFLSNEEWEANLTVSSSSSYDVAINITGYDLAGNVAYNATQVLTIDNIPPSVAILYPISNNIYSSSSAIENYSMEFNYSINGSPSAVYYSYNNKDYLYGLPISSENLHNITYSFPGKQSIVIFANDSVGNIGYDTLTFYTEHTFNSTKWILDENNSNSRTYNFTFYNDSLNEITGNINISSESENNTLDLLIIFDDMKSLKLNGINLSNSLLNSNITVLNNDSNFIDNIYPSKYGSEVIDYIGMKYTDFLDYENMTLTFSMNSSEFNEIYVYRNDSGTETRTAIAQCSGDLSSQGECYYDENLLTKVNSTFFTTSVTNYYAFILVNDTLAPEINITTTNNSIKTISTGHHLIARTNEQASCFVYFNDSSLSNLTLQATRTYFDFTLPTLLNGDYQINISCNDSYGNTDISWINMSVQDNVEPFISLTSPANLTTYTSTGARTISLTTDESATCRYNTSNSDFDYTLGFNMTSTGSTIHSFSYTLDNTIYNFYYKCEDLNGNINTNSFHHRISVNVPSDSDDDDTTSDSSSTTTITAPTTTSTQDLFSSTYYFSFINSEDGIDVTINRLGVDLTSIVASINQNISNLNMEIKTFKTTALESGESSIQEQTNLKELYKYVRITPTSTLKDEFVDLVTFTFRVEKSWFSGKNFEAQDIVFYKFLNDTWVKQSSIYDSSDDSYYYYVVYSEGFSLYAIMAEAEETLLVEPETQENNTVATSGTSASSDTTTSTSSSSKVEPIISTNMLIGLIIMGVLGIFGYLGFKNKDLIQEKIKQSKERRLTASSNDVSNSSNSSSKSSVSASSKPKSSLAVKFGDLLNKSDASLSTTTSSKVISKSTSVNKNNNMTVKQAVKAQGLHKPHEDVDMLVNSLRDLFKDVWKQGHSETAIKDSLYKHGWPVEKVEKAFDIIHKHLENDFLKHKLGTPDPDVENLVRSVKSLLGEKNYGYTQDQIEKKLEQKGWPKYLIDEALIRLSKEMAIPFELKIDSGQNSSKNKGQVNTQEPKPSLAKTPSEELKELENYIKTVKKHGKKQDEVRQLLLSYGWQQDIVDKLLSMYFK